MGNILRFGALLLAIVAGALALAFGMTVQPKPLLAAVFAVAAALLLTGAYAATLRRVSPSSDIASRGQEECSRAARYGTSLTLLVIEPAPKANIRAVQKQLVKWLRSDLRRVDAFGYLGNGCCVVLLPETTIAKAEKVVARLQSRIDCVQTGLSTFPEDGATYEQLYATAKNKVGEVSEQAAA